MDFFEYLTVMYSIILGLGLADLLRAVGRMVSRAKEVRWDLLYVLWLIFLLGVYAGWWWGFWDLRVLDVDWTFGHFLYVLLGAAALVLATHVFLPDDPGRVESLRDHYAAVSRRFFLAMMLPIAWAVSLLPLFLGRLSPSLGSQVIMALALVAAAVAKRRAIHLVAVAMALTGVAVAVFVTRATPT